MRILLVEDEVQLSESLAKQLRAQSFTVDIAGDGADGLFQATEYAYDLAIVDLGLPKLDGMSLIEKIRIAQNNVPILVLTARSQWQEKVKALETGADDYLTKPFQFDELLARVKALLRRSSGFASSVISFGEIALDLNQNLVTLNKQMVELTAYEYKVLEYLFLHPHQITSKTELTEHIYEQDYDRDSNVLEVFIRRLRKKLDPDSTLQPIETLRGRGYRINPKLVNK
jgi:two-component system response regulator PhoP